MPVILTDVLALLGFIIRLIGFLVFGLAVGRFVWDNFKTSEWQVKLPSRSASSRSRRR